MVWEIGSLWGQKKLEQQTLHWVTSGQAMPAGITWTLTPCALLCSLSRLKKQHKPTQNTPAGLRDGEKKTREEAEPSGLCPDRGAVRQLSCTPEQSGREGRMILFWPGEKDSGGDLHCFLLHTHTPELCSPFPQSTALLYSILLLSVLNEITAGLDLRNSQRVWKADRILIKKNGGGKRNPEAAEMFKMPYLVNKTAAQEGFKELPKCCGNPLVCIDNVTLRWKTKPHPFWCYFKKKPCRYHFKEKLLGWKYFRCSTLIIKLHFGWWNALEI